MKFVETFEDLIKLLVEFDSIKYETIFIDDLNIFAHSTEKMGAFKKVLISLNQLNLILHLISGLSVWATVKIKVMTAIDVKVFSS